MKLESVNGNLLSLTLKNGTTADTLEHFEQQQQNTESLLMTEEDILDETGELEGDQRINQDAAGSGGSNTKKKGTRKKRSLNWEEAERALLLEVIKPKADFVENRMVDAKSIKAKRLAWLHITKQFNSLNFRHRSLEQIQVQWRSMKNLAKREHQQKNPKAATIEGLPLLEFMDELQKDPMTVKSQSRGQCSAAGKKENSTTDLDDEDMPLAALPAVVSNTHEDSVHPSTTALPSPPPSCESQQEVELEPETLRSKKKLRQVSIVAPNGEANVSNNDMTEEKANNSNEAPINNIIITSKREHQSTTTASSVETSTKKRRRQRSQNSVHSDVTPTTAVAAPDAYASTGGVVPALTAASLITDDKYKKQIFELLKRARLADMDYARREHEQKLHYQQLEEDMKLLHMKQEHEMRMLHTQLEHEARIRIYTTQRAKMKFPHENDPINKITYIQATAKVEANNENELIPN